MGMTIRFSAPGRAGILGNPSDIYGGKVLSVSLALRNSVEIQFEEPSKTPAIDPELPDDLRLWDAAIAELPVSQHITSVRYESQVPKSSGLAGSTALLTAVVAALRYLRGEPYAPRPELAELVRNIERHRANVMCGYQDAYMTVHGGAQLMNFAGKHPVSPGPHAMLEPQNIALPFLLITTGVERLSGSVHGPMSDRWLAGESLVRDGIARISALAELGLQAIKQEDWSSLSALMTENQEIITRLGGSGEPVDQLIDHCLEGGAMAAKLAGAGMGGTVISLTSDSVGLQAYLESLGYQRFTRPVIAPGVSIHTD